MTVSPKTFVAAKSLACALVIYWAASVVFTAVKAASTPFNGPVEQYLSREGSGRVARAVDMARLAAAVEGARASGRDSALDLVSACHDEVSRSFEVSGADETGIDRLLEGRTGVCFDFCGATYALALQLGRSQEGPAPLLEHIRWVRGFVRGADTLESAHSWLEAVGPDGRWRGYDASIDTHPADGEAAPGSAGAVRRTGGYVPLNCKRADLDGRVSTSLAWGTVVLARKNVVSEASTRLGLPPPAAIGLKAAALAALFVAAWLALRRPGEPARRGAPAPP